MSKQTQIKTPRFVEDQRFRKLLGARGAIARTLAILVMLNLMGCSIRPIPDDLYPDVSTQDIVVNVRCELRRGILDAVEEELKAGGVGHIAPSELRPRWKEVPKNTQDKLIQFAASAISYDFDFDINEHNDVSSDFGFSLPFIGGGGFNLDGGAAMKRVRSNNRKFSAGETFIELVEQREAMCRKFEIPGANYAYPLTGSIGARKTVRTFLAVAEQGGAKNNFVDVIQFTTDIDMGGGLKPKVTLKAKPASFRLVSASANVFASRHDLHKLTLSIAFPQKADKPPDKPETPKVATKTQPGESTRNQPGERIPNPDAKGGPASPELEVTNLDPRWRSRYNLCVSRGEGREDNLKALRLTAPEVYCIEHTDVFFARHVARPLETRRVRIE